MDMSWLSAEAKLLHEIFSSFFYSIILLMITFGVVMNFFKMPLGQVPEFLQLVGRAIIAAFILAALPEIMNFLADITDELSAQIGQINNFKLVVGRLGEKIGTLTWSWVSFKDSVLLLISYLTFFILYVSVYIADAMYLLIWTLLYIFSPLLIAAFTLPSTAAATKGLFQSLIEVCLWKVCWSVLAALLWSFALSEINKPEYDVDFFTAIILNVMLAFSVLLTPMIVKSLLKGGLSSSASTMGSAILATAALTPSGMLSATKSGAMKLAPKSEDDNQNVQRSNFRK
jgi:hypothetical protein